MLTNPIHTAYTLFLIDSELDPQILLISTADKKGWRIPSSKINDHDGFSVVNTCARIVLNKLGNLDIRDLSLGSTYDFSSMINWESYDAIQEQWAQEPYVEMIESLRNPFTYMWQKYFTETSMWNDLEEEKFIYFVKIQESDIEIMKKQLKEGTQIIVQPLSKLFDLELSKKTQLFTESFDLASLLLSKTYLQTEKSYIFIGFKIPGLDKFNPPRPFLHTYAIFNGLYRRRQEKWLHFNAPNGHLPTEDQLSQASAVVLSGSGCSAYDDLAWIKVTEKFLFDSYNQHKHLKFLTICFGLQVVTQAFGGKVEPLEKRKADRMFYLTGNEILMMKVEEFKKVKCFENLNPKEKLLINKAHGDEITVLPEFFINLATSRSCQNEILISNDHRIFGYQSHPEFSNQQQITMRCQMNAMTQKRTTKAVLDDEGFLNNWSLGVNDKMHRDLCKAFLKK